MVLSGFKRVFQPAVRLHLMYSVTLMNKLLALLFFTLALTADCGAGAVGKRVALVIGNSAYRHVSPLPNPVNDARSMAAALQRMDMSVDVVLDADRAAMLEALKRLSRAAEGAQLALVHFSGHGIEINGTNYLVPISAELTQAEDADAQAIAFNHLYAAVEQAQGMKLILLDACRDNPFALRLGRAPGRGLSAPSAAGDILIAYATKHGSVAEDGPLGGNSPFTAALIKHMERPLDIRLMFNEVRDDVLAATAARQSPFIYGQLAKGAYSLAPSR
jgi:uncharacterized caspase-like protein